MARSIGGPMAVLVLSDEERSYLERQVRRRRVARSISDRCRMILHCADGLTNKAVAAELGVHEHTVGKWRRRFLKERIEGLSDEPRPGRPRTLTDEQVAEVIERTLETTPADATHWSIRSMARESGLSHTTIRRNRLCTLFRRNQHVVGDRFGADGDGEQGAEGGVARSASVEAEDELVEIGLQVFPAQPVIDPTGPALRLENI